MIRLFSKLRLPRQLQIAGRFFSLGGREHTLSEKADRGLDFWVDKKLVKEGWDPEDWDKGRTLVEKRPLDSLLNLTIPIGSNPKVREEYVNFFGGLRFGRVLEDLDSMAGHICFVHMDDFDPKSPPQFCVTASLDRIVFLNDPFMERDLVMRGCCTHTGRTSAVIDIDVWTGDSPLLQAEFTMVGMNMLGDPVPVNPIVPQSASEKEWSDLAVLRRERRKTSSGDMLTKKPPTSEELAVVHKLFVERLEGHGTCDRCVMMDQTRQHTVQLCHRQARNVNGKLFGGHIMRRGFECAWTTAYMFSKTRPRIVAVDDTTFLRPVEIGSVLEFSSVVSFSEGGRHRSFTVTVDAHVVDPVSKRKELSNTLNYVFIAEGVSEVPRVIPQTYGEAMIYLEARRRHTLGREIQLRKANVSHEKLMRFGAPSVPVEEFVEREKQNL